MGARERRDAERINPGIFDRIKKRSDRELAELAEKYDMLDEDIKQGPMWHEIRSEIQREVDSREGFPYDVGMD